MNSLQYSVVLQDWTEDDIKLKIDFKDPLQVSQGDMSDSIKIKVVQPSLFVSAVSGKSLQAEDSALKSASIPRQLPKGIVEEDLV